MALPLPAAQHLLELRARPIYLPEDMRLLKVTTQPQEVLILPRGVWNAPLRV